MKISLILLLALCVLACAENSLLRREQSVAEDTNDEKKRMLSSGHHSYDTESGSGGSGYSGGSGASNSSKGKFCILCLDPFEYIVLGTPSSH